jgi:hypothetical protein
MLVFPFFLQIKVHFCVKKQKSQKKQQMYRYTYVPLKPVCLRVFCNFCGNFCCQAWLVVKIDKNFFFEAKKGQVCVCFQNILGTFPFLQPELLQRFQKKFTFKSERKHPKFKKLFFH